MAAPGLTPSALATGPAAAALEGFIAYLAQERRASPRTLESYRHGCQAYLDFLAEHRGGALTAGALIGVTPAEVRAFLAWRRSDQGGELAPRSLSQNLSAVRSFHRWLDRRHGIANPTLALVRLQLWGEARSGLLAFGSPDPAGFTADMGGELVAFLARVVERTAERWPPLQP